jgi:hypothetical protein
MILQLNSLDILSLCDSARIPFSNVSDGHRRYASSDIGLNRQPKKSPQVSALWDTCHRKPSQTLDQGEPDHRRRWGHQAHLIGPDCPERCSYVTIMEPHPLHHPLILTQTLAYQQQRHVRYTRLNTTSYRGHGSPPPTSQSGAEPLQEVMAATKRLQSLSPPLPEELRISFRDQHLVPLSLHLKWGVVLGMDILVDMVR